ncbi:phenylpyruvate tautomerase MIF-related protein [Bifidobacterium magnum]|uniref:Macrophage migration inhibitory factor (MIF) n=1 Tax=Bifidobacterium magnum TaxID=1692 RepID=A0A087BAW5_9BIFI|nr:phenylpyruvate tautomerase MIF-related protein [Bifidobacterium magnum]KFI68165.1 Macrophage migration inhibitory factor (MIF) [Bifidobacterium magnum]
MPVIHVHTSEELSLGQRDALKAHFGRAITAVPGKTEQWLMCIFEDSPMYFGGDDTTPSAYVEVNVFGDSVARENWEKLTTEIMGAFKAETNIPNDRTYIRYTATKDWGWNGSNF